MYFLFIGGFLGKKWDLTGVLICRDIRSSGGG